MRLMQYTEQLLILLGNRYHSSEGLQHLQGDLHRIREERVELVIFAFSNNPVVDLDECMQLLGL